jgi:penicillin-insensitive murein endopeptidase
VFNKFCYDIEFDLPGRFKDYSLDYEALAALIVEIHKQTKKRDRELWRVIFDPKMTPDLLKTSY